MDISIYELFVFAKAFVPLVFGFTCFIQFQQNFILECHFHAVNAVCCCKDTKKLPYLVIYPRIFSNSGRNTTNTHYKIGILQQSI